MHMAKSTAPLFVCLLGAACATHAPLASRVTSRYTIYAPATELARAGTAVEQAQRQFELYFGQPAPPVALVFWQE
jgi:hypothetical protein